MQKTEHGRSRKGEKVKYTIDDLREAETKDLDVTQFFPKAKESVFITIRRLESGFHNRVINFLALARYEIEQAKENGIPSSQADLSGWDAARLETILGGVVIDDKFPFEQWDKETIKAAEQRNPSFISFLYTNIQGLDRPLAEKMNSDSEK